MNIDVTNYDKKETNIKNLALKGVKSHKLIKTIQDAPNLKKIEITFDELERMYNELGYDVIRKRGSHAIVQINEKINIPIVIPHHNKYVHRNDLKRFLHVSRGNFEEAAKA